MTQHGILFPGCDRDVYYLGDDVLGCVDVWRESGQTFSMGQNLHDSVELSNQM